MPTVAGALPTPSSRGLTYAIKSDDGKAIANFTEAIRLNPADPVAYWQRALPYFGKAEFDKARGDVEAFLATGSEAFVPSIGYFVWLASMIAISCDYWKLGTTVKCKPNAPSHDGLATPAQASSMTDGPDRSTDILAKCPSKRFYGLIWTIPSLVLVLIVVLAGTRFLHRQHIRNTDERIVMEVEDALARKLHSLPPDDDITQRYGKFLELTDVRWDRPSYAWQLVVRLDWSATAHFEKAQSRITLGIDRGENRGANRGETLAIQRLEMHPSEAWRREQPALAGEMVLVDRELWQVNEQHNSRGPCTLDGWATHPDSLYD